VLRPVGHPQPVPADSKPEPAFIFHAGEHLQVRPDVTHGHTEPPGDTDRRSQLRIGPALDVPQAANRQPDGFRHVPNRQAVPLSQFTDTAAPAYLAAHLDRTSLARPAASLLRSCELFGLGHHSDKRTATARGVKTSYWQIRDIFSSAAMALPLSSCVVEEWRGVLVVGVDGTSGGDLEVGFVLFDADEVEVFDGCCDGGGGCTEEAVESCAVWWRDEFLEVSDEFDGFDGGMAGDVGPVGFAVGC